MSCPAQGNFFTDPALIINPYPYYESVRARGSVYVEPNYGVFVVSGYDEAVAILKDHKTFSSCIAATGPLPPLPFSPEGDDISEQIEKNRHLLPYSGFVVTLDRPGHAEPRKLLSLLFAQERDDEKRAFLRELANRQIDRFIDRQALELVYEYASPFATISIANLLGVPLNDCEEFCAKLSENRPSIERGQEDEAAQHKKALELLAGYFSKYIEERRRRPSGDSLSDLANGKLADGSLPDIADITRLATFVFGAGQDTSVRLIASAFRILAERQDVQSKLRSDRKLIPSFIEEALRYESPFKSVFRLARSSTSVAGITIPAGAVVMILLGAANRDPRRFDRPNEFIIDRRSRGHLAFAGGIHRCPGAGLARAEARATIEAFFDRTASIDISEAKHGPADARRYDFETTYLMRALKVLHLEFLSS
jgi:cytochrome P450